MTSPVRYDSTRPRHTPKALSIDTHKLGDLDNNRFHDRALSSAIFSTAGSSGSAAATGGLLSRVGTHNRSMTLPQLNAQGLPAAAASSADIENEVQGLPGRARLSRPVDAASPFAPSAVFSSSRGLSRIASPASPSTPKMLPSHTVKSIDQQRKNLVAYEYLCHVQEAREWMDSVLSATYGSDENPSVSSFEQSLRNGIALARLARRLGGPECQGPIFNAAKLQYRHTDNIDVFFTFVKSVGLPEIFRFETNDLYNAKNLPKVIYCLHALALVLDQQGIAERMQNLYGKVDFSDDELNARQKGLEEGGQRMPNFGGLDKDLNKSNKPVETAEQKRERQIRDAEPHITAFQAQGRGAIQRWAYSRVVERHRRAERERKAEQERLRIEEEQRIEREQIAERQRLRAEEERVRAEQERKQAIEANRILTLVQATARGVLARKAIYAKIDRIDRQVPLYTLFQAHVRGAMARKSYDEQIGKLEQVVFDIIPFQAVIRKRLAQVALLNRIRHYRQNGAFVTGVQAAIRRKLAQQQYQARARSLRKVEVVKSVNTFQSLARAALLRRNVETQKRELGFVEPDVIGFQAHVRGFLQRTQFLAWHEHVHENEHMVIFLQTLLRGQLARRRFDNIHRKMYGNEEAITRFQALVRSKIQRSMYQQLRSGKNVPVSSIRNFAHLLDDSEFDFREEARVQELRKVLVRSVRETQSLEDDVKELDTKIALLVKNKITYEVARMARHQQKGGLLLPGKRGSMYGEDIFLASSAGMAIDRQTQRKLDLYQQLFYHLQTTPAYLARLFHHVGSSQLSTDKLQKMVEHVTMVVFGYAQNAREELLLLKLFQQSIAEEARYMSTTGHFASGNFTFMRLWALYGRGVEARDYLRRSLTDNVTSVLNVQVNFGLDPVAIYKSLLDQEEQKMGSTRRPREVNAKQALGDQETKSIFVQQLTQLRAVTDALLRSLYASTHRMPYGLRYIGREVFRAFRQKFPNEPEIEALRLVGSMLFNRIIQPAIVAPETFDIVGEVIAPHPRRNLAELAKMVNQISLGRVFDESQEYLTPLNEWLQVRSSDFARWTRDLINVDDAERHFKADQYVDATASSQPVIYISPNDIYCLHSIVLDFLDAVAPQRDDPVRAIIVELGGAPSGSTEEMKHARAEEIELKLTTRVLAEDDPSAPNKALMAQAKRRILAIIKVQNGNDLEEVLAKLPTDEDEMAWQEIAEREEDSEIRRAQEEQRQPLVGGDDDIRRWTFTYLKQQALIDLLNLKRAGLVDRTDKYQSLLNSIADDIRGKHHRRVQRQNELATMNATLASLGTKQKYLNDQIDSYNTYIDQSLTSIQKKGKKRLVLPWSMQASHERKLERTGKTYKFGSYKYSAETLYNRGVLLSVEQYSPRQFDKVSLTFSSDQAGVFEISAHFSGEQVARVDIRLSDLLESQFAGKRTVDIGSVAKLNLDLLVELLNRKFFAEE